MLGKLVAEMATRCRVEPGDLCPVTRMPHGRSTSGSAELSILLFAYCALSGRSALIRPAGLQHGIGEELFCSTVSTCRKSTATIPEACACKNCRQVGPARRDAGSMPAARKISQTVDGATRRVLSVRRESGGAPTADSLFARRTMSRMMPGTVGGRLGLRRLLVSYVFAASLRCQARSVAGVTGKTSAQRLRGMSRASPASQTRSAGS
jgi:hypothetical protein